MRNIVTFIPKRAMKEYSEFLEQLRISGKTNMFGARPYLMEEFGLSSDEAGDVLHLWMKSKKETSQ